MNISIVIPVFHPTYALRLLVEDLVASLEDSLLEIILVDDGSDSFYDAFIKDVFLNHSQVTLIRLRKNFGEHNAVLCGLRNASGDYIITMDDDMQNPASETIKLFRKIEEGYDVVYANYSQKKHSIWRNMGSWFTNKVADTLMDKPKGLYLSSFRIMRKDLVEEILKYQGPFPYIDGLIMRTTRHIGTVETLHHPRKEGKSGYSMKKLVGLYLNVFINFSVLPLRWLTIAGFLIFLSGLILSGIFVYLKFQQVDPPGWTSTVIFILLTAGFQSLFLGLIGEYLGRLYLDINKTPAYAIRSIHLKRDTTNGNASV